MLSKSHLIKYFLILFALLFNHQIKASSLFVIDSYTVKDGLSHNTIWCALQDSCGFIWLGTNNGLNCFDGQKNTIYRTSSQEKAQSLGSNFIFSLFEDKQRQIWIGTDCGIYIYDRKNSFKAFTQTTKFGVSISSEVRKIVQFSDDQIAIATLGQGVFFYNLKTKVLEQNNQCQSFIWDMYVDAKNEKLYVSSLQEGILCFNKNQELLHSYPLHTKAEKTNTTSLKANSILAANNRLWIGTDSKYLFEIDPSSDQITYHRLESSKFQIIQCLISFNPETFLIGTDNGVFLYNYKTQVLSELTETYNINNAVVNQNINSFIKDKEGGIWALTNQAGAVHIIPKNKIFNQHIIPNNPIVNTFYEDNLHRIIWIGTQKGLFKYNIDSKEIQEYNLAEKEKQIFDIRTLCLNGNELWIGTFSNGLKVLNLSDGKIKSYHHSYNTPNTVCSDNIQKIYKCNNGTIYIGTNWGLCYYNSEEDNFRVETSVGAMISITDIFTKTRTTISG